MHSLLKFPLVFLLIAAGSVLAAKDKPFPGKKSKWQGFDMYQDGGRKVIAPAKVADGMVAEGGVGEGEARAMPGAPPDGIFEV